MACLRLAVANWSPTPGTAAAVAVGKAEVIGTSVFAVVVAVDVAAVAAAAGVDVVVADAVVDEKAVWTEAGCSECQLVKKLSCV